LVKQVFAFAISRSLSTYHREREEKIEEGVICFIDLLRNGEQNAGPNQKQSNRDHDRTW
jgi:hypothetical protein